MSETKHTPGPWRSSISKNNRLQISGYQGRQVCIVWRDEYSEANARIIAAAPELLEALKCISSYPEVRQFVGTIIHDKALAATTKAEGGE